MWLPWGSAIRSKEFNGHLELLGYSSHCQTLNLLSFTCKPADGASEHGTGLGCIINDVLHPLPVPTALSIHHKEGLIHYSGCPTQWGAREGGGTKATGWQKKGSLSIEELAPKAAIPKALQGPIPHLALIPKGEYQPLQWKVWQDAPIFSEVPLLDRDKVSLWMARGGSLSSWPGGLEVRG